MIDLFENIEEVKQEESIQENKQVVQSDDDIDRMIEDQEEYDELAYMVSFKYGLSLTENTKDENLEKIKHLVYDSHYMDFEEEKHQIESLIMDATEDPIQEDKQEEETIQEVKQEAIDIKTPNKNYIQEEETIQEIEIKTPNKNSIAIEESQEDKEIEYNFKQYLKSIIAIQNLAIEESDDSISFNFTIKKADLNTFKQPKVYSSYVHSLKIKRGQEEARKRGKKPGIKQGMKRERKDKQFIIDQIKALSNSFNGSMNNHELAKELNCSLNRICNYKRQIKQKLKNSN